jgi:thioredoxin reductase (NADPH)
VIFGSEQISSKVVKAHQINNYPGFYGKSGMEIATAFLNHMQAMEIPFINKKVGNIYDMGGYFSIIAGPDVYEATTVIYAAGVDFGKPVPGEDKLLGRGVSYCATCDGMLYRGKKAVVLAYTAGEEGEVNYLKEIGVDVKLVPLYEDPIAPPAGIDTISGTPAGIIGTDKVKRLEMTDGTSIAADAVFILRDSVSPDKIITGLEMNGSHVKADRLMATNISGFFAAGDITGTPYQYIKAAGEGNVAALSAVKFLDTHK